MKDLTDRLFPSSQDDGGASSNVLTEIHLLKSVDRCPVTGRVIPELSEMEQTLEEYLISCTPLTSHAPDRTETVRRLAKMIRHNALAQGIPFAVTLFNGVTGLMVIKEKQDGNDQRRDSTDDSGNQRLRESSGDRSGDVPIGRNHSEERAGSGGGREGGTIEGSDSAAVPSREGLSRRDLMSELKEQKLDLQAFSTSYEIIRQRVQTLKDEGRMLKLVDWSGTSAVMGSLEMSIHAIERVTDEVRALIKKIDTGEIPNTDEVTHDR